MKLEVGQCFADSQGIFKITRIFDVGRGVFFDALYSTGKTISEEESVYCDDLEEIQPIEKRKQNVLARISGVIDTEDFTELEDWE